MKTTAFRKCGRRCAASGSSRTWTVNRAIGCDELIQAGISFRRGSDIWKELGSCALQSHLPDIRRNHRNSPEIGHLAVFI
jgi:hypothetical protein